MHGDRAPRGLGLIGCGGYGRFCLAAFHDMPGLRIVAVADADERRAREEAEHYGAAACRDAAALIADPAVEVVAVNTPPHLHAPQATLALRAGKHVFVEKPMALTVDDGRAMVEAARERGVGLAVDYVMRYNPLYRLLGELAHRQTLGPLARLTLENHASDESLPPEHWFWDEAQSGGILVEHGVHFFDIFGWLAQSEPAGVWALEQRRPGTGQCDRVWAALTYRNGASASFYHAFARAGRMEQTTVRATFLRGDVALLGWMPTEMELEAWLDEAGLEQLHRLCAGQTAEITVVERYGGTARRGTGGGRPYDVAVHVRARLALPEGKQAVYRRAVQSAMADLLARIDDPGHRPLVGAQDGLASLALALRARDGACEASPWS